MAMILYMLPLIAAHGFHGPWMMDTAQPILVWRAQPQSHQPGRSRCISNTIPNLRLLHIICNFRKGHGISWHDMAQDHPAM